VRCIGRGIRPRFFSNFAVDDDGQRFLVTTGDLDPGAEGAGPPADRINVILNWFEELKQRVPTGW